MRAPSQRTAGGLDIADAVLLAADVVEDVAGVGALGVVDVATPVEAGGTTEATVASDEEKTAWLVTSTWLPSE